MQCFLWGTNWNYKYIYICTYLVKLVQYSVHTSQKTARSLHPSEVYGDRLELIKSFWNAEVWATVLIHKVPICFVIAQIRNQSVGRSRLGKFSFKLIYNFSTRQSDFTITHSCIFTHSSVQQNKSLLCVLKIW